MSSLKNYILVVNPISGDVDKTEIINVATNFAESENVNLIIFETTGKNDEEKFKNFKKIMMLRE